MTKASKRNNTTTVKRTVDQLARPNTRMNLKGRLNENVSYITGNEYNIPASVAANQGGGTGQVILAPGNSAERGNAAVQQVGKYFQKGLFLPGTFVKYIPSVGLNTPGNIIMGYIDNPDLIRAWSVLPEANKLNFVRDLNNAKTAPLWQELTFSITQPPRRKIFMVDPSINYTLNEVDLSVQGFVVYYIYGVDASASVKTYGQLMIHAKCRFEEVKSLIAPQ